MRKENALQLYQNRIAKKRFALLVTLAAMLVAALFAIMSGSMSLSIGEVLRSLIGRGEQATQTVVFGIRLPRVVAAILVGATLSVSGAVMQCVLHNPLASASTLGVSQGAAFGAALGIVVFGGGVVNAASASVPIEIDNPYIVTLCAFVFGSISTAVVIALSQLKRSLGPGGLVLAGVAMGSLFSGGSTLLQYFADETKLSAVVFWTFGNLGSASWSDLLVLAVVFAASMGYFLWNRWNYNAMTGGADTASSLGVNTRALMLVSMAICSLAAAVAVAFVGIISFIGLVAPHMMRKFTGDDYRYLLPGSAIAGGLILLLADTFGRLIIAPVILPVGAITSFLGAPVFLVLLLKGVGKRA